MEMEMFGVGWFTRKERRRLLLIRTVFTSCSRNFLENIKFRLAENNIFRGVLSKGKGNYHRLTYSIFGSLKLYDFMYNKLGTSKLFLKRKKDVFEKFVKMRL